MTRTPARVTQEPRCLSKADAATYAGCDSLSTFSDWVRRGISLYTG